MKKTFKALLGLLLTGVLVGNVSAATLAIGSDETSAGELHKSVTVELKDDDISDYVRVEFQLSVSGTNYAEIDYSAKTSGISFGTFKDDNGATTYVLGTQDMSGTKTKLFATTVGSVSYKTTENLNSDFKITPNNVKFYKEDGSVATVGSQGVKITEGTIKYKKPKSKDATLTSLSVGQWELIPAFKSDVTDYKVQVKDTINQVKITATTAPGATKTGTGNKVLVRGENIFEIEVTAEDGTTKQIYTINVICGEVAEPSPYLKDLTINNVGVELSPEFDSKNNKYTVTVDKDTKNLDIKYELEDPLAKVTIEGNEKFELGENIVTITVVSSDEMEEQVYEIKVTKEEEEEVVIEDNKKEEEKKNNTWIWIIIIVVCLGILVGVAFLLFRKKDTKKEKRKDLPVIKDDKNDVEVEEEEVDESDDDEKTQTFNDEDLKAIRKRFADESDDEVDDKTKEFNFKDL